MKYLLFLPLLVMYACCDCPPNSLPIITPEYQAEVEQATTQSLPAGAVIVPFTPEKKAKAELTAEELIAKFTKNATLTGDTLYTKKSGPFPIWRGPKGGLFTIRISGKTGLPYKGAAK